MNRVCVLVDGFNLYHALNGDNRFRRYKWLDLRKLSQCFVTKMDRVEWVFYYTAHVSWSHSKVNRHKKYIRALSTVGVKTVFGEFRQRARRCPDGYKIIKPDSW